jgi:CheY-like chemotaxis protein
MNAAQKQRLLLVDDDNNGRCVLAAILEDEGYVVTEASSIAEARNQIDSQSFDIALLDLRLPDGFGSELIPALRRATPTVTIAILSGNASEPIKGADAFLTKAESPTTLIAQLKEAGRSLSK